MDDELMWRAERAVLGAMIASPAMAMRLAHLKTADFGAEEHRVVHMAIVAARLRDPQDRPDWREAILWAAGPVVTRELLDSLERACPVPAHGGTYAWLVVQGWATRRLETLADETAARLAEADAEASRLRLARVPESAPAAQAVRHMKQLTQALRKQAAAMAAARVHPVAIRNPHVSAARERQEEIVLAAIAGPWPHRARQIAHLLAATAIGDYYRRAVYVAACQMHQVGAHVDELTLDWQLAQLGLPLRYELGGLTIGMRLARVTAEDEQPIEVARQLQDRYEQAEGARPRASRRDRLQPGPDPRGRASINGGQSPLRLVQPPPGQQAGNLGHGPKPTP